MPGLALDLELGMFRPVINIGQKVKAVWVCMSR